MKYQPTQFLAAVTKLTHQHNLQNAVYNDPTTLQTDETARTLRNKLHATDITALPTLVAQLTTHEKRYLSLFCQHAEPDQRHKAVECLFLTPRHATPRTLWRALSTFYTDTTTTRLAEFMHATDPIQQHLNRSQRKIIAARTHNPHAGLQAFWNHCDRDRQSFPDALKSLEITPNSQFSTQAAAHFLSHGSPKLWKLQGLNTFITFYKNASDETKTQAARQCHENYNNLPLPHARTNPFVDFFIQELPGRSPQILTALHRTQYQTWHWYKRFIGWNRAIDFFKRSDQTDTSRIEFWEEYFEHLYDAEHDQERHILFLTFEHIGIVEFEKSGNAAYIYELPLFQKLVRNYSNAKDLKNRSIMLAHIEHRGDWQPKARRKVLDAITTGELSHK